MCDFAINAQELQDRFGVKVKDLQTILRKTAQAFPGLLSLDHTGLYIPPEARPLTRMIARTFDDYDLSIAGHSSAI